MLGKFLLGFLIVALIAPTVLFSRPQKAEALVSLTACIGAKLAALLANTPLSAVNAVLGVTTSNTVAEGSAAAGPAGTEWATCFLKGLATIIGKTILHTFTQSIVNWINSGFEGSPSFVTNPEGFLNDVADQTIGRIIEDISPLLCSPFKLDIRFALGINLSMNSKEEIHCRLSDVIANVRGAYDGFVTGSIGSGNLSNWIHIAGTQQNNAYGAYISTTNIMSAGITSATGQQIKLLDWGQGFKSWRSCEKYADPVVVMGPGNMPKMDSNGVPITRKGPCIKEGPIKTPGKIIQDQTSGTLNSTLRELEVADEIDAVVGALINQMLTQVMRAGGGLLGASSGGSSGGGNYAQSLLTDPDAAIKGADAKVPVGIDCTLRYYPSTKKSPLDEKVYVADDNTQQVWTQNLDPLTSRADPFIEARTPQRPTGVLVQKKTTQTWEQYFAEVKAGCKNVFATLITDASDSALGVSSGGAPKVSGGQTIPQPKVTSETVTGNIAHYKLAAADSVYQNDLRLNGPRNLVNGIREGGYSSGGGAFADKDSGSGGRWFAIDLETEDPPYEAQNAVKSTLTGTEIQEVRIYGLDGNAWAKYNVYDPALPFRVYITTVDPRTLTLTQLETDRFGTERVVTHRGNYYLSPAHDKNNELFQVTFPTQQAVHTYIGTIKFDTPIKGRYIYIKPNQNAANDFFGFAEIEVIGKQTKSDGSGTPAGPSYIPFSFSTTGTQSSISSPQPGDRFTWEGITFVPNKEEAGVSFRTRLYECKYSYNCSGTDDAQYKETPTSFTNYFNSLTFTYTIAGVTTIKNAIRPDRFGYTYNTATTDGVWVDPNNNSTGVQFVKDLTVKTPVSIEVKGSLTMQMPFRIVIDAIDKTGAVVGSVKANFVR